MKSAFCSIRRELLDEDLTLSICSAIGSTFQGFQLVHTDLELLAELIRFADEAIQKSTNEPIAVALGPHLAADYLAECDAILQDLLCLGSAETIRQTGQSQRRNQNQRGFQTSPQT